MHSRHLSSLYSYIQCPILRFNLQSIRENKSAYSLHFSAFVWLCTRPDWPTERKTWESQGNGWLVWENEPQSQKWLWLSIVSATIPPKALTFQLSRAWLLSHYSYNQNLWDFTIPGISYHYLHLQSTMYITKWLMKCYQLQRLMCSSVSGVSTNYSRNSTEAAWG